MPSQYFLPSKLRVFVSVRYNDRYIILDSSTHLNSINGLSSNKNSDDKFVTVTKIVEEV